MFKIILFVLLLISCGTVASAQSTLPYTQNFDSEDYPVWAGSRHTYLTGATCYGGSGGCAKFLPQTDPGQYSGMGAWPNLPANTTRINVRVLVKVGSTYHTNVRAFDAGTQNKMLEVLRSTSESGDRLLGIYQQADWATPAFFTWGACVNNLCRFNPNTDVERFYPYDEDIFHSTDYIDEWVAVEWEYNITTGLIKTYIWTQDGANNGLHVTGDTGTTSGTWANINILGGYFNSYHVDGENNYLIFDNLIVSDTYIGPPAGFVGGGTANITGVTFTGVVRQ